METYSRKSQRRLPPERAARFNDDVGRRWVSLAQMGTLLLRRLPASRLR